MCTCNARRRRAPPGAPRSPHPPEGPIPAAVQRVRGHRAASHRAYGLRWPPCLSRDKPSPRRSPRLHLPGARAPQHRARPPARSLPSPGRRHRGAGKAAQRASTAQPAGSTASVPPEHRQLSLLPKSRRASGGCCCQTLPSSRMAQAPRKAKPRRCWKQSGITSKGTGLLAAAGSPTPAAEAPSARPPQDGACCTGPAGSLLGKNQLHSAGRPRRLRAANSRGDSGPGLRPRAAAEASGSDKPLSRPLSTGLAVLCRAGPPLSRAPRLHSAQNQLTPSARPPPKGETGGAGADRR